MRRVLIISPHFPPTNSPDLQRVRTSLPYYRDFGWTPSVLAVGADTAGAPRDSLLNETIPSEIDVRRVRAWPLGVARRLGIGNVAYRSWFQLGAAGRRWLREQAFDLVFFSTTQYVATSWGPRWQRECGVPFVVDVQDPWRTDYYERAGAPPPPGGWKYRFARRQAERLESRIWQQAGAFMSVSPDYIAQLTARYPWFASKPTAVIPFGATEADFSLARSRGEIRAGFIREPGKIHLAAVGAVGPIMQPAIERLFEGVRAFRLTEPALAGRLRFHFLGTSYAGSKAMASVLPIAASLGVGDLVTEKTERVGYFEGLRSLLAADALVIPGSTDRAYRPSKLGNCYLAQKPTLVIPLAGSEFETSARELAFSTLATFPSNNRGKDISTFLLSLFQSHSASEAPLHSAAVFERNYSARGLTGRQCELFDRLIGGAS